LGAKATCRLTRRIFRDWWEGGDRHARTHKHTLSPPTTSEKPTTASHEQARTASGAGKGRKEREARRNGTARKNERHSPRANEAAAPFFCAKSDKPRNVTRATLQGQGEGRRRERLSLGKPAQAPDTASPAACPERVPVGSIARPKPDNLPELSPRVT